MPRPDINDPPIDDPDDTPLADVRPRPGHSPRPQTTAEQGKALPIVYGQAKVEALLLEKQPATTTNAPLRRTASSQVYAGEYRTVLAYLVQGVPGNDGSFLCTQTGVTGPAADFTSGSLITPGQVGIVDGGCLWTCISLGNCEVIASQQFTAALCEGEIVGAISLYWDKEAAAAVSLTNPGKGCGLAVGPDAVTQNLAGYAVENYQHTAVLFALAAPTGTQKEIPAIAVELKGVMFGGAGPDVSPADILNDLLTHTRRGAGWAGTRVDSSITGSGVSGYRTYCDAYGLRVSMVIDSQQTAAAIIAALLAATNCEAVWSQGSLHCVPLGDTSSSSPVFGATNYTAPSTAVASFGPADFLDTENPVQVQRRDEADCFNAWPIEFTDRSSRYARATVEDQVLDDVEVRGGVARAGVTSYPIILPNGTRAVMLSRILGNRSTGNRNTYTLRVGWASGVLLEPCDLFTVTEPGIGLVNAPMRATSVSEAEDGTFSIAAEDWPVGVQSALAYVPQANDGLRTNDRASLASGGGAAAGTRPVPAPATVGAAQVAAGSVGTTALTISNLDNLWPNATSELAPPTNADTTFPTFTGTALVSGSAEWFGRVNAGAGAYAGNWVRQLTNSLGAGNFYELQHRIPCSPGEAFYLEGYGKLVSGSLGTGYWYTQVRFRDSSGTPLTSLGQTQTASAWTLAAVSLTAPAAAVQVEFTLGVLWGTGGSTPVVQFDALYARRMVGASVVPAGALPAAQLTPTNFSNVWPNPSSENLPPPGADLTAPEWANRVNAGGGAFSGSWVREITAPNKLTVTVACAPGDTCFISAYVKKTASTGTFPFGFVYTEFLDSSGSILSGGQSSSTNATSWTLLQSISLPAPAGTVAVRYGLTATVTGTATFQFDSIFADRAVDPIQVSPGTLNQVLMTQNLGAGNIAAWGWVSDLPQDAWHAPTLLNSWVNFGGAIQTAGYFKDSAGVVHLRGSVKSGTMSAAIFNLPAGYRPSLNQYYSVQSATAFGRVLVDSSGNVIPDVGANSSVSLDGISFDTR